MSQRGRPRDFDSIDTVEKAMRSFWKNGYEGCSTGVLCEDTGLGKGSLYNAFGSKHELYRQALDHYHEKGIREQRELLKGTGSVRDRLYRLLDWALQEDFQTDGPRGCFLIQAGTERGRQDMMVESVVTKHIGLLREALEAAILDGLQSGEIAQGKQACELAVSFLSSYYGFRVINVSTGNRKLGEDMIEGILNTLFRA